MKKIILLTMFLVTLTVRAEQLVCIPEESIKETELLIATAVTLLTQGNIEGATNLLKSLQKRIHRSLPNNAEHKVINFEAWQQFADQQSKDRETTKDGK